MLPARVWAQVAGDPDRAGTDASCRYLVMDDDGFPLRWCLAFLTWKEGVPDRPES